MANTLDKVLIPQFTVKLDGTEMKDTYDLKSINIHHAINNISTAQLELIVDFTTMEITNSADFNPGKKIEILLGYYGEVSRSVFKGIIVNHKLKLDLKNGYLLKIACKNEAEKMTYNETERHFENHTDDAVIRNIIGEYGFSCKVGTCNKVNECTIQKKTTDWNFILSLCDFNRFIVTMDGDSGIRLDAPDLKGLAVLQLEAGNNLFSFEIAQDAKFQLPTTINTIKGNASFEGNALAKTGSNVQINGVGERLSGKVFVSEVTHLLKDGSWTTTIAFGLDNHLSHENRGLSYPSAIGQIPAIQGLQLATVKKIEQDPDDLFRIQLEIPSASSLPNKIWARMAHYYASNNAGSFFLPEINDEVVLGFLDNDPRLPVILGSLYNRNNAPPYMPDDKNEIKAFVTRSKMKIEFDEEKKNISFLTPGDNSIKISDDGKSIELKDQNGNSIKLSPNGITIDSKKNIKISATGNIIMDANANVSVTAKTDVALNGLNVSAAAKVGFTATGNATAELSATGQTTVKGAMVMIN